jgi:Protein of unknown function (DUF3990)
MEIKIYNSILDFPDEVFHGTSIDCVRDLMDGIDLDRSRQRTDFGKGFYLTTNYNQAKEWAKFKANPNFLNISRKDSNNYVKGAIVTYNIDKEYLSKLPGRIFTEPNDDWAIFILANRTKRFLKEHNLDIHNLDMKYHYVYGPMADNGIALMIKEYELEIIDVGEFCRKVRTNVNFPNYHQLSIHTIKAIECFTLKGVEVIEFERAEN